MTGAFLRGRHRGRRFDARISPGVAVGSSSDGGDPRFNLFELSLLDVAAGGDWSVLLREVGRGREPEWRLEASNAQLAAALGEAGVVDAVKAVVRPDYTIAREGPVLACRGKDQRLVLRSDADESLAPPPAWVERALAMLLSVAEINTRLNGPT